MALFASDPFFRYASGAGGLAAQTPPGWAMTIRFVLVALVLLPGTRSAFGGPDVDAGHGAHITLSPCPLARLERKALCGRVDVAEDPKKPGGRRISVAVAVLPARRSPALPDPIIPLMGGPGESAIDAAGFLESWLRPLLLERDLLLIDQRGTGRSQPLHCDLKPGGDVRPLLKDIFPPKAVKACVARLRERADLTQYGYTSFARDVEFIRRSLGYGKLNIFAASYGTRALQVFLRSYPESVRTAFFSSVVPIDMVTPETMAATARLELERLFKACAIDEECRRRYPSLPEHFEGVMNRLARDEVYVALPGRTGRHLLRRGPVASWIRARLYRPSSAAILPLAIERAYHGDWRMVRDGVLAFADVDAALGLFFAITCNEDMKFLSEKALRGDDDNFLGQYRVRQQLAACEFWPKSMLPEGYRTPVQSDVPALFSTGENDGGTPVWFTEHVARGFDRAAIIKTPMQGHTEWNDCVASRYHRLVNRRQVPRPRVQRCPAHRRPPFKDGLSK